MSRLLPSRSDPQPADGEPRVVGVDSDDADDLIAALSSETARNLLAEMHEEPGTPSELSNRVDTTLQNTQYHIGNLEDANLVDVVDTVYSEKGREMKVYAPADRPLVLFAGRESESSGLKTALTRLLGSIGALAAASAVAHALLTREPPAVLDGGTEAESNDVEIEGDGADAGPSIAEVTEEEPQETSVPEAQDTPAPEGTPAPDMEPTAAADDPAVYYSIAEQASSAFEGAFSALPPGMVFFLGGLSVLLVAFLIWYVRTPPERR